MDVVTNYEERPIPVFELEEDKKKRETRPRDPDTPRTRDPDTPRTRDPDTQIVQKEKEPQYPMIDRIKQPKQRGWWIFKAPVLIYLLLTYAYVYLGGQALTLYLKNSSIVYALLGLHTIIVIMFIMLLIVGRK